ncbi:polysaccharide biosynthesis/export family protein [Prosthecobacter sp.]|uniref:polysaccharide biosynthesis/export family protein n=1 Tax=Prosthecobacter sp. TaxID=1965333 RepID=UPI00248A47E6|nr:polysaccharide biosynthesis/export family protein [Prosthecobacter sp.]MDI1310843.1 polysaccharide biosynthesis/export family protein [Prosthecobacter sp.]
MSENVVRTPIAKDVFLAGDNLELFVKEDATLNNSYPVREGGYIVIPRAGRISVSGLSRAEAEARVKEALQGTQLTKATVLVERMSKSAQFASTPGAASTVPKIMVYITGAVKQPGTHFVPSSDGHSLGIYETLLITGGLGRLAQDQRVEVMRVNASGRRQRAIIDIRKVALGLADDPPVGEGDIIHVPEKVFGF